MLFVSMKFPFFLGAVVAAFFLLPPKWRSLVLLFASCLFCLWIEPEVLVILLFVSVITWAVAILIDQSNKKGQRITAKICLVLTIGLFVALLLFYKSVGMSFYLFQAIGYLTDVYRGKSGAEHNFGYVICYFAFFPKFISGPIERKDKLIPQLKALERVKFWDRGRLSTAFTYLLWGYFMKMVVADRLVMTVNQIFGNPAQFDSFWLIVGAVLYTVQIYCDFAGYSYIAIGCAKIFGINLTHNFETPYMASSISEFWRRWHISLSTWLKDYLYIPMGGNRNGLLRKCINLIIVFGVCGIWHGTGANFLFWGMLHGIYSILDAIIKNKGWKIKGGQCFTFIAVTFAWIFFRADSLDAALIYIGEMGTSGIHPEVWRQTAEQLQLNAVEIAVLLIGVVLVWMMDELCSRRQMHLPVLIQQKKNTVRYLIFYLLLFSILIFGIYGPGYHVEQFIYMKF